MMAYPGFSLALSAGLVIALALSSGVALAEDAKPADEAKPAAETSNHTPHIEAQDWTFEGPFGSYDNAQLQRGGARGLRAARRRHDDGNLRPASLQDGQEVQPRPIG